MNKVFVLAAVFVTGAFCGYKLPTIANKPASSPHLSSLENSSATVIRPVAESRSAVVAVAVKDTPDEILKLLSAQTPKTQFEGYRAFQKLDQLSIDELEKILLSLDDSQLQLKGQISWFLSGKFPERAFALMESSMGDNQMSLAQTLFANLSANHPEHVFDWLQNNENDFAILFSVAEQQFERKMALFQALSVFPDWKWTAYDAGVKLVKESVRPQDKWSIQGLAQTVALANPMDAINYALAQHNGAVDKRLLNGALVEYAKTNPLEAKRLLLENQPHLDESTVSSLVDNLLFRGQFGDVYSLTDSLTSSMPDKKMVESVVTDTAGKIHKYGSEKVVEFIATVKDPALKVKAVSSATSSMSVAGYPIDKLLAIMDEGLRDVPAGEKAFQYAWTLKSGYKNDAQSIAAYMNQLKFNNKELAVEVEKILEYLKDS